MSDYEMDEKSEQKVDADIEKIKSHWNYYDNLTSQTLEKNLRKKRQAAFQDFIKICQENKEVFSDLIQYLSEFIKSVLPITNNDPGHILQNNYRSVISKNSSISVFPNYHGDGKYFLAQDNNVSLIDSSSKMGEVNQIQNLKNEFDVAKNHLLRSLCYAFEIGNIHLLIPENEKVEKPIILSLENPSDLSMVHNISVEMDKCSQAKIIIELRDFSENKDIEKGNLLSLQVVVEENSKLELIIVQNFSQKIASYTTQSALMKRNSLLDWTTIDIGGCYVNNTITVIHDGEGAESNQKGIYVCGDDQNYYYDTHQIHAVPETKSRLLFKGIHSGNGISSWKGNILVAKGADRTDSYQINRNLILSPDAKVTSIPGLEILADDVKCSHGAAISNIDENELFYLLSRGIPREEAIQILAIGYAEDVLRGITKSPWFDQIIDLLKIKLEYGIKKPFGNN